MSSVRKLDINIHQLSNKYIISQTKHSLLDHTKMIFLYYNRIVVAAIFQSHIQTDREGSRSHDPRAG